jgi:predicted deacylase
MKIGTCEAVSGKVTRGLLKIGEFRSKTVKIPVLIAKGEEGKNVFISGGMHGDEINGIELVERFVRTLNPERLSGTVVFLPLLNPSGFQHQMRNVFYDDKDLNRCFGRRGKSISYRMAKNIIDEAVRKCEFGIDCHDSGRDRILFPHSRIFKEKSGVTDELASIFGTDVVMRRDAEPGMIALESYKGYRVPVLTVEAGGGMIIRNEFIRQSLTGLRNILSYYGMLSGKIYLPRTQFFLSDRKEYVSDIEGVINVNVSLGSSVNKEDVLAEIYDPTTGETGVIKAKNPGIVFHVKMGQKLTGARLSFLSFISRSPEKIS